MSAFRVNASADGKLEVRARAPVVPERLDVRAVGLDLRLLGGDELEQSNLHAVVLKLRLLYRTFAEGEDGCFVSPDDAARILEPRLSGSHLAASVDGKGVQAVKGL